MVTVFRRGLNMARKFNSGRRLKRLLIWLLFVVVPAAGVFFLSLLFPQGHHYREVVTRGDLFLIVAGLISASIGELFFTPSKLASLWALFVAAVQVLFLMANCLAYAALFALAASATEVQAGANSPLAAWMDTTIKAAWRLAPWLTFPPLVLGAIIMVSTTEPQHRPAGGVVEQDRAAEEAT